MSPMYPESFLYWVGGTAIILGIVGCMSLLALMVNSWYNKRHHKPDDDDSEADKDVDS